MSCLMKFKSTKTKSSTTKKSSWRGFKATNNWARPCMIQTYLSLELSTALTILVFTQKITPKECNWIETATRRSKEQTKFFMKEWPIWVASPITALSSSQRCKTSTEKMFHTQGFTNCKRLKGRTTSSWKGYRKSIRITTSPSGRLKGDNRRTLWRGIPNTLISSKSMKSWKAKNRNRTSSGMTTCRRL